MAQNETSEVRHATSVSFAGRAVLIEGPSGSGKSGLALQLMAFGAGLIADDYTVVTRVEGGLQASAPPTLPAAVEARGVGILPVLLAEPALVRLVVDLGARETRRLPEPATRTILGHKVALCHKVEAAHFAAGILQYLKN